jgi:hypothetical protein
MAKVIGIRLGGHENRVQVEDFLEAGNNLLELLNEIDITISPSHKFTACWYLKTLSYASPAVLEVEADAIEDQTDNRNTIISVALGGIDSLKKSDERPRGFTDKALEKARDLGKLLQNGLRTIEVLSEGTVIPYEVTIISHVDTILTPGKEMFGSVEGTIERMNSHGDFEFWLYEPIHSRRIKCELMDNKDKELKDRVVPLYEHDVIVSGVLLTNITGEVNAVKVINIVAKPVVALLKDASEVTGIWDFTGGQNPVDHIRGMRDDS